MMKAKKIAKILSQTRDIYNAIAPDFSDTRSRWWRGFGSFNRYARPGDRVLDLGCGNGRMAEIFVDSQVEYLGADNSEELIKIARQRFADQPWVKFTVADVTALENFPAVSGEAAGGGFNLILLLAVLHHIPTRCLRLKVLRDIYKLLAPGGRLVISNWNLWQAREQFANKVFWFRYWRYLLNWPEKIKRGFWGVSDAFVPWKIGTGGRPIGDQSAGREKWQWRFVHSFTLGELQRLLRDAGFAIEWIKYEKKNGDAATILTGANLMAVAVKK